MSDQPRTSPVCSACGTQYEWLLSQAEERVAREVKKQLQERDARIEALQHEAHEWRVGVMNANKLVQERDERLTARELSLRIARDEVEALRALLAKHNIDPVAEREATA